MTLYFQDHQGIYEVGCEEFFSTTGAQWTEEMKFSPILDCSDLSPDQAERELMQFLLPQYRQYQKNPPKLCLHIGSAKGKHSVCAMEMIKKGTIVTEYLGEWSFGLGSTQNSYRWGPIDGLRLRNWGGMVEDGFPNVGAFHLYRIGNVPLRIVFVALEDIHPGDMLAVHYGMNHSVKLHYHAEYRFHEITHFFSQISLETMIGKIRMLSKKPPKELGWNKSLELEGLVAKLRYLFQTPGTMMLVLNSGIMTLQEVSWCFQQADFRYFILRYPFLPNRRQKEIMDSFEFITQKFSSKLYNPQHIQELLGKIRHCIFFQVFCRAIEQDGAPESAMQEACLWNEVFDSVQNENIPYLEFKLGQSNDRDRLIQAASNFANEIGSPLTAWLQSLLDPPTPLSPAI